MSTPQLDIPPGYFLEVRDPATMKLVCRYNPRTGEVVTIGRSGDVRRGVLPVPCEQASEHPNLDERRSDRVH